MNKLFRNCFILVVVILFAITPIALADQLSPSSKAAKSDNLATNKPVTASGQYQTYKPQNAVDGNANTYWAVQASSTTEYITVDLQKQETINKVQLKWSMSNYPKNFSIKASTDGNQWLDIKTLAGQAGLQTIDLPEFKAQYVKFSFNQSNSAYFTVYEIGLFNESTPPPTGKTFIVTHVNDNLDAEDATIMINRLNTLGYTKLLENPNVTAADLKSYLARKDVSILYHTGHGSAGSVATAGGSLAVSQIPIANETSIFATCLTVKDTNFKNNMQPTCLNIMGYTNYSYDITDNDVVNQMADAMQQGNSIVKAWYLANSPISSLNDRWLEYCREDNQIVEYSARSGNVPKNSMISWQPVNGQSNIKINSALLTNNIDFSTTFNFLANTVVRVQSSTGLTETYTAPNTRQPFVHKTQTANEAVQIAEKWLNSKRLLPQDFILDSITPVTMTINNQSSTIAHTLRYVRSINGLKVKNNTKAEHITLIINDNKVAAMTKLVNNIATTKLGTPGKITVLPVKRALETAAPQISRILKAPECKIVDIKPCYSYLNHRLIPAYELIDETGSSLIINATTGQLVF